MSSVNFDDLAAEFPEERQAIKGLEALFAAKRPLEVSFDHLVAKLRPHSVEALALLLSELVEAGLVRRKIRVESPSRGGGIGDFDSLDNVPERLFDWRSASEIDVTPRDLKVVYTVGP
jgi:hypothetical protein